MDDAKAAQAALQTHGMKGSPAPAQARFPWMVVYRVWIALALAVIVWMLFRWDDIGLYVH